MAELVSTAIVHETVSQVLSGIVQKYEEKDKSNANTNLERLEMAHIRLEAALETSEKWQGWRLLLRHLKSGRSQMHPYCVGVGS